MCWRPFSVFNFFSFLFLSMNDSVSDELLFFHLETELKNIHHVLVTTLGSD